MYLGVHPGEAEALLRHRRVEVVSKSASLFPDDNGKQGRCDYPEGCFIKNSGVIARSRLLF
jgi:hypothetical protein